MGFGASLRKRKATELSVGQQQRVAAARALIGAPQLLIADEPTSSLDADARTAFLDLLERQCDLFGSTLLFVSHDRQLAGDLRPRGEPAVDQSRRSGRIRRLKHLLILAIASAWNRRFTLTLTIAAIALSVAMLLGVERARNAAHESFAHSISGTDLVVGPRTSPVQLMLYAVFRMGDATTNMKWKSYEELAQNPDIEWIVPLSIGDSHHGFPVVGTTTARTSSTIGTACRSLSTFAAGRRFEGLFETVLGADVAERMKYKVGDRFTLSHGTGEMGAEHADKPFTVVGILARTGTPVDRSIHVSLESMEAIHLDWQGGMRIPGLVIPPQFARKFDLAPKEISAALVGLKLRGRVFQVQRTINNYAAEPLVAVMPSVALNELWGIVGVVENTLLLVSGMIVVIGLCSMIVAVWAGLNERRRELAILRSVGAGPVDVIVLLALEGFLLTVLGVTLGFALLTVLSPGGRPLDASPIRCRGACVSKRRPGTCAGRNGLCCRLAGSAVTGLARMPSIARRRAYATIIKLSYRTEVRIMKFTISMIFGALMLTCLSTYGPVAWAAGDKAAQADPATSGFRIGDTLPPVKPRASSVYRDIGWDSLLPEGFSVEKIMDDLKVNELGDNDPKAREALQKMREVWDKAPANPKINNKRVSIAGFVVPLDGEREKTREFLLVPYFGACVHAPAPPANQVIHVTLSKSASSIKLTPAALLYGTIRVLQSDTKLAVTGYEMTVDKVEPYKPDDSPFSM